MSGRRWPMANWQILRLLETVTTTTLPPCPRSFALMMTLVLYLGLVLIWIACHGTKVGGFLAKDGSFALDSSSRRYSRSSAIVTPAVQQQKRQDLKSHPAKYSSILSVSRSSDSENASIIAAESTKNSLIKQIKVCNLVGVVGREEKKDSAISIPLQADLVCITGETGSGKSLLVARVVELLTGAKAAASFVRRKGSTEGQDTDTWVEMEMLLSKEHLLAVERSLRRLSLDPAHFFKEATDSKEYAKLVLKRSLALHIPSTTNNNSKPRLKSICEVNGRQVTLKTLAAIASPLLTVVDTAAASNALSKPNSRMAILDTAVPSATMALVANTKSIYRKCRMHREELQHKLASRVLPSEFDFNAADNDRNLELLEHWIEELDAFEVRARQFCDSAFIDFDSVRPESLSSTLVTLGMKLSSTSWMSSSSRALEPFSSSMYTLLTDFRDALQSLDRQIALARNACDALSSLSSSHSAATALENARNSLVDATQHENSESKLMAATEKSHELLNIVESALEACSSFIEDDEQGVVQTLEAIRFHCQCSVEDVDSLLLDWKTFARKHGISPFSLPSCHAALKDELDGGAEAQTLLPKAIAEEERALVAFEEACAALSKDRQAVADELSQSVNKLLPSLGMDGSNFRASLETNVRACSDASTSATGSVLGVDSVDFLLLHGEAPTQEKDGRGGKVHEIASAGEKTRLLLAIENSLPSSIGVSCGKKIISEDGSSNASLSPPPVAVLYDEIDAHVGGRAAVSMAGMLADQSSSSSQVVVITHNPSVAALADLHILIQKAPFVQKLPDGLVAVEASAIDGAERRKELARMTSGDLVGEEAERFAEALINAKGKWRSGNQRN